MALKSVSGIVDALGVIKPAEVAKNMDQPNVVRFVQFIETLGGGELPERLKGVNASSARPFVTPMAWALYEAYSSIVFLSHLTIKALKERAPLDILNTEKTIEVVKTALPDLAPLVDKHGVAAFRHVLPDLEERLIKELQASAAGREADAESVERASRLMRLVHEQQRVAVTPPSAR